MKRNIYLMLSAFVLMIAMTSCDKSAKSQIVGKWKCELEKEADGAKISIKDTSIFNDDGTGSAKGSIIVLGEIELEEENVGLEISADISEKFDWEMDGDKEMTQSPKSSTVKVTSIKIFDLSDESKKVSLASKNPGVYNTLKKEIENDKGWMEADTYKIKMLKENKMVLEYSNDGEKIIATYKRID